MKTPEQLKAAEKEQALCERFNKKHQPGDAVEYWTGDKATGDPAGRARIVQPAFMQGENTALVMLEGIPGALKLADHTFKEAKPAAATK